MDTFAWNLIDKYFKDNPYNLVAHHLDSYNDFFSKGIFQIFRENNPIRFIERFEKDNKDKGSENRNECFLYLGGKSGDKLYLGKPIIYDSENDDQSHPYPHYMYPNDARLRNMTYGTTIHYDVDVDFIYYNGDEKIEQTITLEKIYLGRFPIMVQSNLCILKGLATEVRYNLGECRNDYGGYFIIDGKEKCIVSQEKFADNMLYVRKNKDDNVYSYSCEVRSVSEDSSKPIRYTSVKMVAPDATYSNNQIVVDVPNVRKPIPLFILMRALGVVSDKSIIEYCLLDLESNSNAIDSFIPSVHDATKIFTQKTALEFIATFTKRQTISAVLEILMNYFLPHVGEDNFLNKAYYVGFMVNKLLGVYMGREKPTDRDNFKFKRVETSGTLIYDLFREYFLIQNRNIFLKMDREFYYHPAKYRATFISLIQDNYKDFFKDRVIEDGFKKGFKGNWGADPNTKRIGLVQDLNRLSWFSFISHLRKISLPLDPTSKVTGPHYLHGSQWGIIDPVDTPDGGNVGLHKHMSISTAISNAFMTGPLIKWLRANTPLKLLQECNTNMLAISTKMFVNGNWIGIIENPIENVNMLKLFRRNGVIPIYTSISFSYESNVVYIYTDSGRLTRPIYYRDTDGKISYAHGRIKDIIESHRYTWQQVVSGFQDKRDPTFSLRNNILYDSNELYPGYKTLEKLLDMFTENKGIVDYIDTSEEESALIAMRPAQLKDNKYFTHAEIDPSLMFGVMGNSIIYPEANQLPRDVFSCGQSKQAVSVYHSNYQMRLDKMGVILNYGQTPLIKSRYLEYINNEEQPYGVNAIVAIMSYTGYNVEDAILINEGSVKRGLFRTTYYTTYESREENSKVSGSTTNSFFTNIESKQNVTKIKEGFDYSQLDAHGLVKENTEINEKVVLIGQVTSTTDNKGEYSDNSKTTKKGQLGFVDKSFISEGEEGFRIAKIRVREERLPAIGDKMASRAGQKGTLGLIIPEEDMPFTSDGVRPDLIINPHALPSRMTIGQLIECLFGKACSVYGGYGDCTAYSTNGANYNTYGPMLTKMGYHNSGNQILYNGYTGEQIYSDIFIGPTYYMRLKHMVKDKINYRATGKRSSLTRQTNQGRANDGGLRLGEMERDGIMGHGMSYFLNESYMVRGDEYFMAVCNKTGAIAVYNPERNLFLSPFADGPLVFSTSKDGEQVLDAFSLYGRSFSLLRIPYALKLMMQELQVLNIQMRIITEDNVDQLLNLSYQSQNIDKLLNIDHGDPEEGNVKRDIKEIIDNYKKQMTTKAKVVIPEARAPQRQQQQQQQQEQPREYETEVLQPVSPVSPVSPEKTTFGIDEIVVVKNEETRAKFPATIIKINKNEQGEELYDVKYFDDERENNVNVNRISLYEQGQKNALTKPASPDYSPSSPVYNPDSPDYSPNVYAYSPPQDVLSKTNAALGELGENISSSVSSAVSDVGDTLKSGLDSLSAMIPGSPQSPQSAGGLFSNNQMNQMFSQLPIDKQQVIMQLGGEQRHSVMNQIMNQANRQNGGGLSQYFGGLPMSDQLKTLQRTYLQKAGEFGKLAEKVNPPTITTIVPHSAAEQMYGGNLKLFAPEAEDDKKSGGKYKSKENDAIEADTDKSSNTGDNIKRIVM
jgi:DNA-directed RNA polymerase II subunit RPB2